MKIQRITFEHRNDFNAILECEHCAETSILTTGYHDSNYHVNVIPRFECKACGKNRAGTQPETASYATYKDRGKP